VERLKAKWHCGDTNVDGRTANIGQDSFTYLMQSVMSPYTVRSEIRCALRLRYVDLVVSVEVAVAVCCCFTVFSC
jgi:hypothetical protein